MKIFEEKEINKDWEEKWLKPLDFIKDNFQKNLKNDPIIKKLKERKRNRIFYKNMGILASFLLFFFFSKYILYFLYIDKNKIFAESFLSMEGGVNYAFVFMFSLFSSGITSLFIEKYYTRKIPKEEKEIIESIKTQLKNEEGKLLYTTFGAYGDVRSLFNKINTLPSVVYALKKYHKNNSNSVVSQYRFFETLDKIMTEKINNIDYYIFAYGIEDVRLTDDIKKIITKKMDY